MLDVVPQLVSNNGLRAVRAAIAEPQRFALEPKIDGVRGLIVFRPDGVIETRNRSGRVRDWQRHRPFATPDPALAEAMIEGRLEGLVLKDRSSRYRDGSRAGWSKVKDRSWYEREAWRFDR